MSDQAQLTVHRGERFSDRLRPYKVSIDGQTVATVKSGESVTVSIAPGPHTIRMRIDWCGSEELSFDAKPGEQIVFKCASSLVGWRMLLALWYILFEPRGYILLHRKS